MKIETQQVEKNQCRQGERDKPRCLDMDKDGYASTEEGEAQEAVKNEVQQLFGNSILKGVRREMHFLSDRYCKLLDRSKGVNMGQ